MAAAPLSDIEELLAATGEHLEAEDERVGEQDPSPGFASILDAVLDAVRNDVR